MQVFDDRLFEGFRIRCPTRNHRDLCEARYLRCPPTSFAGDEFERAILIRTNDQRLQHADFSNRIGQLLEALGLKLLPGLVGVRDDAGYRHGQNSRNRLGMVRRPSCRRLLRHTLRTSRDKRV